MKRFIIFNILLFTEVWLFAQELPFEKFDKNRMDVGTLYVYELSTNEKNFKPSYKEYFYIKTLNDIENIGIEIKDTLNLPETFFKYKLNWDYMMLEQQEYISLKNENDIRIGYAFRIKRSIDFKRKTLESSTYGREKDGFQQFNKIYKFASIPTYFYRYTYLVPLWFTLRFYPFDKKNIVVNHNHSGYDTEFVIEYMGKEEVVLPYGRILCHKFELVYQMSFIMKFIYKPQKAWIWLTSEDKNRYMVKYRNNNEVDYNPSIEYRLVERKKMTIEEWGYFKKSRIKNK